ncbi:hypothetical protein DFH08DRAFT_841557 [Mycena albidolilacea]|uniref:F-box domain-containing protein n=1 Tax=Mycena albidolilacea TaxID=1033008 RepID=A0AAD7F2F8_9AGAR|nr:hypothetical protein DFH08DRAFT_841557 [Mycena albidolilacea]
MPDPETPPSELHRALQVPEVVWMIVSYLDPRPDEEMADLAALAQCRIFHGPALDALWRHQGTIRNLINCMPDGLWVVETVQRRKILRLSRPVQVTDWDRVLQYSHRVRSFAVDSYSSESLSQVFEVLRLGVPGDYLLPNLEMLQWRPDSTIQFADINLFLGPRIASIELQALRIPQLSLLTTLTRRFPGLTAVTIDQWFPQYSTSQSQIQIQSGISAFARGLKNVRYLNLQSGIDVEAITNIGGLSTLETLRLHLAPPLTLSSLTGLPQGALFHYLRSADFSCHRDSELAFVTLFVRSWANPSLRSFKLKSRDHLTVDETEELYRALSAHCSHDALESLTITVYIAGLPTPEYIIPGRALQLLFCFTNLVTVTIKSAHGYLLDDETITELAAAWPQIKELHLSAHDHLHQCGTLLGLHAFARHCPNLLHTLELSFDASSVPAPHPDPSLRQKLWHPALESLDVAYSLISNAFDVARFISATFFNVTELYTALADDELEDEENTDPRFPAQVACHKLWREVETLLPRLNDIRAEEFHWAQQAIDQKGYIPVPI